MKVQNRGNKQSGRCGGDGRGRFGLPSFREALEVYSPPAHSEAIFAQTGYYPAPSHASLQPPLTVVGVAITQRRLIMARRPPTGSRSPIISTLTCDLPADAWERYNIQRVPLKFCSAKSPIAATWTWTSTSSPSEWRAAGHTRPRRSPPCTTSRRCTSRSRAAHPVHSPQRRAERHVNAARQAAQACPTRTSPCTTAAPSPPRWACKC